ncbi:ras-related and estrogen-regulated growth inhibitor-like protein isoform X3 [Patagioenas fasciata]|uniref:ras-related and estrogen-regulated growth inhibitor-like protein isoform X3 n=1 Tax=Patagioenas fasciata TaxID=372321 RepID=UPI003A990E0A
MEAGGRPGGGMTEVKLAVLGGSGAGKSALAVRFLTRRFIGEYASNAGTNACFLWMPCYLLECIYTKHLCLDGRQIHLEIYDPCSQPQRGKLSLTDELHWADGFIIVYDISDRASFAFAKALLYRIRESHIGACKKCFSAILGVAYLTVLSIPMRLNLKAAHVHPSAFQHTRNSRPANVLSICQPAVSRQLQHC